MAQKTWVFWLGLLVFGVSLAMLIGAVWALAVPVPPRPPSPRTVEGVRRMGDILMRVIPPRIFGSLIFLGIGAYMMREGKK